LNDLWGFDLLNFSWFFIGQYRAGATTPAPPTSSPLPLPNWPSARHGHCMAAVGSNLYVFGGHSSATVPDQSDLLSDLWVYSTLTRQWTQILAVSYPTPDGPGARGDHTCVSPDWESLLIFGGWTTGSQRPNDLWRYVLKTTDTFSGGWQQLVPNNTNIPIGRTNHVSVMVYQNQLMYILGGNVGSASNEVWYYDYQCNIWIQNTNNGGFTARYGLAATWIDNTDIGIVGGIGATTLIQTSVSYDYTISTTNVPTCTASNNPTGTGDASSFVVSSVLVAAMSLLAVMMF